MTDHITEKKVESEGKVFNKNRGKTVSKSRVFHSGSEVKWMHSLIDETVETLNEFEIYGKYTVTITKHLD